MTTRAGDEAGALAELPIHLGSLGVARAWIGDFADVALIIAESASVAAATGSRFAPFAALRFRALQGREADASALIANAIEQAAAGGQGMAATQAYWAAAVLYNGLGRYEEAASAPRQASSEPSSRGSACGRWSSWSRRGAPWGSRART